MLVVPVLVLPPAAAPGPLLLLFMGGGGGASPLGHSALAITSVSRYLGVRWVTTLLSKQSPSYWQKVAFLA